MIIRIITVLTLTVVPASAQQPPEDFVKLRENYNQAIERATKPITATYVSELRKLQDKHTRAGNLDAALLLKQELERISDTTASVTTTPVPSKSDRVSTTDKKAIESRMIGRMWGRPDDIVHARPHYYFRKDGTVTRVLTKKEEGSSMSSGTWQLLKTGVVKVDIPNVRSLYFRFPDDNRCFEIAEADSDKEGYPYVLIPDAADPGKK